MVNTTALVVVAAQSWSSPVGAEGAMAVGVARGGVAKGYATGFALNQANDKAARTSAVEGCRKDKNSQTGDHEPQCRKLYDLGVIRELLKAFGKSRSKTCSNQHLTSKDQNASFIQGILQLVIEFAHESLEFRTARVLRN